MGMRRILPQPDLFETPQPRMVLDPAERTKLVDQLQVLLIRGDGDAASRRSRSMGGGR